MANRPRRRRARSARRIALLDQILALLRDSRRLLTTQEVAERLGHRLYYSDAFAALAQLEDAGAILKLKHPLLKNVLWGVPGKDRGFAYDYAVLREEHAGLRRALEAAPAPAGEGAWMEAYRDWWQGPRRAATGTGEPPLSSASSDGSGLVTGGAAQAVTGMGR